MYDDISRFLFADVEYPISKDDCFNSIALLHSFYSSSEKKSWINVEDNIQSDLLGRENDSISDLYRI